MDSLYRRRIPTGHASFDGLYVKLFGDIPEEQNSRILQDESFESLYRKYHNDKEDISRERMYDDLYVKYADGLQVFGGRDDSIDFVYTLIDNSLNGNYNTSTQHDSLIPPPITRPPLITSPDKSKSRQKSTNLYSPKRPVPEKIQSRSSMYSNSSSASKTSKTNNTNQIGSVRVLRNHQSDVDAESNVNKHQTSTTTISDNNRKNFKESNGIKKISLTNHLDDGIEDDSGEDPPKKKIKLNRSKET